MDNSRRYKQDNNSSQEYDTSSVSSGHSYKGQCNTSRHTIRHSPSSTYNNHRSSSPDEYNRRKSQRDRYDHRRSNSPDEYNKRKSQRVRYDYHRSNSPDDYNRRRSPRDRYDRHRSNSPDDYNRRRSPRDRYDRQRSNSPDEYNRKRNPRDRYDRQRSNSPDEYNRRRSPRDRYDRQRSSSPDGYNRKRSPRDRYDHHRSNSSDGYNRRRRPRDKYDAHRSSSSDEDNNKNNNQRFISSDNYSHLDNNLPSKSNLSKDKKKVSDNREEKYSPSNNLNQTVNPSTNHNNDATPSRKHYSEQQSSDLNLYSPSNKYDHPWDSPSRQNDLSYLLSQAPLGHLRHVPMNSIEDHDRHSSVDTSSRHVSNSLSEQPHINSSLGKLKSKDGDDAKLDIWSGAPLPDIQRENKEIEASQKSINEDPSSKKSSEDKLVYGKDENEERGNWSGKFDFILSMIGYAVGLGNIWRFPYLCYRNGGGAFLFPFLLMMATIGLPVFYLEAALGQFSSCGAMTCWQFAPFFKGLGIAMVAVSAITSVYYNMIIGWSLHYMFSSFTSNLPFASCSNKWNTENCKLKLPIMTCEGDAKADNGQCLDENSKEIGLWNKTLFTESTGRVLQSPSQEYWERSVLNFSSGIDQYGMPKWDLVLCLLLAWIICFLCLIKGIKTTGKVVYFTALFPYVVLIILLLRGVTLENAAIGIKYFITPNFARLADASVWKDAANQVFFSMSIAGGGLITLSSYNRFHNNILRDSIIVAVGDSGTCILGGFVIFSYLGYMAGQLQVDIEDVAADGAGLAFVVYPEAVSNLPPPTLWSILFFIMLLTLGLDSQFAMVETVLSGVMDQYPRCRPRKTLVILAICIILFILGLPLTCAGGMYLLQLMDNYVGGMTLIIIGFVEIIALVFVYGANRFCRDIHLMTGSTHFLFWKVTWFILSPLVIAFIFIFMFVDYKPSTYDKYTYPTWADVIGWFMTLACVLPIPVVMIVKMCGEREGKSLWQKIRLLCLPTVYWGPALKKHRVLVNYVDGFQVDPYKTLQLRTTYVNYGFDHCSETSLKHMSHTGVEDSSIHALHPWVMMGDLIIGSFSWKSALGKQKSFRNHSLEYEGSKSDNQASLGVSRISIISAASKATTATAKSGMTYESNV